MKVAISIVIRVRATVRNINVSSVDADTQRWGTPQIGDSVISYSISSWCIVEEFIPLAFDLNSLVVL